jgi:hypothetical protein
MCIAQYGSGSDPIRRSPTVVSSDVSPLLRTQQQYVDAAATYPATRRNKSVTPKRALFEITIGLCDGLFAGNGSIIIGLRWMYRVGRELACLERNENDVNILANLSGSCFGL